MIISKDTRVALDEERRLTLDLYFSLIGKKITLAKTKLNESDIQILPTHSWSPHK
jgi:hypothetical protein